MRKLVFIVVFIIISFILSLNLYAKEITASFNNISQSFRTVNLKINDDDFLQDKPIIVYETEQGGVTMVPVRSVFEEIGATVQWISNENKAVISMGNNKLELILNDKTAYINNEAKEMIMPALILTFDDMEGSHLYVPARFVAEHLGMNISYDGNTNTVTFEGKLPPIYLSSIVYNKTSEYEEIKINISAKTTYREWAIPISEESIYHRLIFDFFDTDIFDTGNLDPNSMLFDYIRYAYNLKDDGSIFSRIVVNMFKETEYTLISEGTNYIIRFKSNNTDSSTGTDTSSEEDSSKNEPIIDTEVKPIDDIATAEDGNSLNIEVKEEILVEMTYEKKDGYADFKILGIELGLDENDEPNFKTLYYTDNKTFSISFFTELGDIKAQTLKPNDDLIESIQVVKNKTTNRTIIVFNIKQKLYFDNITVKDLKLAHFRIITHEDHILEGQKEATDDTLNDDNYIEYSFNGSREKIKINIPIISYRLVPNEDGKIVISVNNSDLQVQTKYIPVDSNRIKEIRYARHDDDHIWFVIEPHERVDYSIGLEGGNIVILVSDLQNKDIRAKIARNISYYNTGDRVYLILNKAGLTSGNDVLIKYFKAEYDYTGLAYTMTFDSSRADLDKGIIRIDDAYIKDIEIIKNTSTNTTKLIINTTEKYLFSVFRRVNTNVNIDETAITLLKIKKTNQKIIVLDPGHGGADPGAVVGAILEKDINLAILLKLKKLLDDNNIDNYAIREDDSYVALYERPILANYLKADLFLSIHNNVMQSKSHVSGTETYYYRDEVRGTFTNDEYARTIQRNLLDSTGAMDRLSRPATFVVLRGTIMPAVLVEVGYMTNEIELNNLLSKSYQDKVARGLYNGLMELLNEL